MSPAISRSDLGTKGISTRTVLVCAWPALLLATVYLLPFLSKAFTNDDPGYLGIARQVLKSHLHPIDFETAIQRV